MMDVPTGNIQRSGTKDQIPLYIGSGDFGGCFDIYGMQASAFRSGNTPKQF